jgi:hypothetical protein
MQLIQVYILLCMCTTQVFSAYSFKIEGNLNDGCMSAKAMKKIERISQRFFAKVNAGTDNDDLTDDVPVRRLRGEAGEHHRDLQTFKCTTGSVCNGCNIPWNVTWCNMYCVKPCPKTNTSTGNNVDQTGQNRNLEEDSGRELEDEAITYARMTRRFQRRLRNAAALAGCDTSGITVTLVVV